MKERLDLILVHRGYFENIEKAKRAVMAGLVIVNENKVDKPGTIVKDDVQIRVKGNELKYVSRGGLKLEKAINEFQINFADSLVIDVGASTGGFTDCALQNGAKFVYSVDVGTNQLDWKLRQDHRVKSIENKHIKDISEMDIDYVKADYIVVDVSFISLTSIFYKLNELLDSRGKIVALIKPQFELEKENIDKGGIVNDFAQHIKAIKKVFNAATQENLYIEALTFSPIIGTKGNVEYLAVFSKFCNNNLIDIDSVVENGKKLKEGSII